MYEQTDRPLRVTTPLSKDALLVQRFRGREAISELFRFEFELAAEIQTEIPFDSLLGKKVTLTIHRESGDRYFNGIVQRISQGPRTEELKQYILEVVPQFWLLTRTRRSRIFQQKTIPEILKAVLAGLDVSYEIQGDFKQREYCVQYQETDFHFACRLMEEEGIFYFFKHTDGDHTMVLANTPGSHPDIPFVTSAIYEEALQQFELAEDRVVRWYKGQEIRTPKFTVWDEHFQLPHKHLDADKATIDTVQVGETSHKLKAGSSGSMELYEFPGEYSRHFDGINKSGGEQPDHLQWIFDENKRIAEIRMQQEAVRSILINAKSIHSAFTAGHTFDLTEHFSDNGKYVLTSVLHEAQQPLNIAGSEPAWTYTNDFTCIPMALPYRPQRVTEIPRVRGVQLATVVGPPGEEIFTDKYSRVKVQFHWDREGTEDADSSCWMRVGTFWAGKNWGAIHIPRVGQEVIVDFEEGDVDHPIIVGSVYNAEMMPPYTLPDNKTQSGIKSRSSKQGTPENYNEIRFEDKKGSEQILIHAELDEKEEVERDRTMEIGRDDTLTVVRDVKEDIGNTQTTEAKTSILIKVGQSSILIEPAQITIKTLKLTVQTEVQTDMSSKMTTIKSDAITTIQGALVKIN